MKSLFIVVLLRTTLTQTSEEPIWDTIPSTKTNDPNNVVCIRKSFSWLSAKYYCQHIGRDLAKIDMRDDSWPQIQKQLSAMGREGVAQVWIGGWCYANGECQETIASEVIATQVNSSRSEGISLCLSYSMKWGGLERRYCTTSYSTMFICSPETKTRNNPPLLTIRGQFTFNQAIKVCHKLNRYPVSVTNAWERAEVTLMHLHNERVWLGCRKMDGKHNKDDWVCIDPRRPWSPALHELLKTWAKYEPNSAFERCLEERPNGRWNDLACAEAAIHAVVCGPVSPDLVPSSAPVASSLSPSINPTPIPTTSSPQPFTLVPSRAISSLVPTQTPNGIAEERSKKDQNKEMAFESRNSYTSVVPVFLVLIFCVPMGVGCLFVVFIFFRRGIEKRFKDRPNRENSPAAENPVSEIASDEEQENWERAPLRDHVPQEGVPDEH